MFCEIFPGCQCSRYIFLEYLITPHNTLCSSKLLSSDTEEFEVCVVEIDGLAVRFKEVHAEWRSFRETCKSYLRSFVLNLSDSERLVVLSVRHIHEISLYVDYVPVSV